MKKIMYYIVLSFYIMSLIVFVTNFFVTSYPKILKIVFLTLSIGIAVFSAGYLIWIKLNFDADNVGKHGDFFSSSFFDMKNKFSLIIRILLSVSLVTFALFCISDLFMNFILSGSPSEIDGLYYIVNHNIKQYEISQQEYKIYSLLFRQCNFSNIIFILEITLIALKDKKRLRFNTI